MFTIKRAKKLVWLAYELGWTKGPNQGSKKG